MKPVGSWVSLLRMATAAIDSSRQLHCQATWSRSEFLSPTGPTPRVPLDLVYERSLLITLQLIASHHPE